MITKPVKFKGKPVMFQTYGAKNFKFKVFEDAGVLWFLLSEVAAKLEVTTKAVTELLREEPEDFAELSDGRPVIKEGGFYYLALFCSETPEAKQLFNWVFKRVVPDILEKGYYSVYEGETE